MITLRHHVLTIVAVFLALAAGIVLGGGPLSEVGPAVTSARSDQTGEPAEGKAAADYNDSFVTAMGPAIASGRLADRSVAVVTVPGADEQLVTALTESIAAAGGTVSARYRLADASTYDRMGQLVGLAVSTKEAEGTDVTGKARAIVEAVSGAGLMEDPGAVERRAPLVLLVLGTDAHDEGSDAILAGLAKGLAAQAAGVVVAGTVPDGGTGQLGRFRADPAAAGVASVDGIDTPSGRLATIMTLQRSLTTPGGSFGASGSDGAAPLG